MGFQAYAEFLWFNPTSRPQTARLLTNYATGTGRALAALRLARRRRGRRPQRHLPDLPARRPFLLPPALRPEQLHPLQVRRPGCWTAASTAATGSPTTTSTTTCAPSPTTPWSSTTRRRISPPPGPTPRPTTAASARSIPAAARPDRQSTGTSTPCSTTRATSCTSRTRRPTPMRWATPPRPTTTRPTTRP